MKKTLLSLLFSVPLALTLLAQTPAVPTASPQPTAIATPSPTSSASDDSDDEDDLERSVKRNFKKHFNITIDGDRHHHGDSKDNDFDAAYMAIPIVGIVFSTLFGGPVLIVGVILFFGYLRSRSLHRTVRNMVEKGQPVPAALFAPPPVVRARSDMRRGVVLAMVGIGLMLFFAAMSDWEGGAWALGLIPFLIGLGYLVVWKLEGGKAPPAPPPLP